jgi:SecD/SecF fusion protein
MQRFWTKIALVVVLLLLALYAAMPPSKKLRLGKDLRGGVTLVYSVEIRPGENPREVLSGVIDVLKERVDPNGMFEISMVPQGRDRIEITMPLPGEDVKAKRAEYEALLERIDADRLAPERVDRAMSMPPDQRAQAIASLAGGDESRREALEQLASLADAAAHKRAAFEEAEDQGADDEALRALAMEAAEAEIEYDRARADFAAKALSAEEVRRALRLSAEAKRLFDPDTGERAELPSPRGRALERLREQYPEQAGLLDEIVAKFDEYQSMRTTLDDPSDLERLLRASGVLSFRITVDPGDLPDEQRLREEFHEKGPRAARTPDVAWFKINQIDNWFDDVNQLRALERDPAGYFSQRGYVVEERDGEYWMLCWDVRGSKLTPDSGRGWKVARAFQGTDQLGRPAINFQMDPRGAALLGALTEGHINDRMAVLLDDEVYTAPNLNSRISRSGQIMGDFSPTELSYIIRVLNAGSLQNKLSPAPISRNAIGPDLGLDYLRQGLGAGIIALIAVSIFMVVYYFRCGLIAVLALACNGLLLLGVMSALSATFTLPGIAGVILTFGMAVDSNVLIFERIREELRAGRETKPAVRLGFSKAMSSIVDGNVTNLIVCIVLANVGTQEIKGFAITLGVGVLTTMFSALVISRLVFDLLLHFRVLRKIRMLPSAAPGLERAFEPGINWLKFRGLFIVISAIYMGVGAYMIFVQRGELMDTEFRGGTQVTLQFKAEEQGGERITMTRKEVEDRVVAIAGEAPQGSPLVDLRTAQVLPLDPDASGIRSDRFMIKSVVTNEQEVVEAITLAFADVLDNRPPLSFVGERASSLADAPVYPLANPRGLLGPDINRPRYLDDVSDYAGGVAIVLENLNPRPTRQGLQARFDRMRNQQDFADTAGRISEVRVLEGTAGEIETAVVLVRDPAISYLESPQVWDREVAQREWRIVQEALGQTTTLASVQSFSAAMAGTFRARAVVAVVLSLMLILIYVWVRFGSVRYSMAAIACLVHDCLTCVGLIALAEIVYKMPAAQSAVALLGIQPFKIDLNMIAALLTIIGYSLNDTIIVMDRVRETRGKLPYASDKVINKSINMTISRTVITSGTTLLAVLILYTFGGEGVRGFAYAMFIGIGIGTYSSIAVAAPLVWNRRFTEPDDTPTPGAADSGVGLGA